MGAGLLVAAKFIQLAFRHGGWDTYPLYVLGVVACLWLCLDASRYVDKKHRAKFEKDITEADQPRLESGDENQTSDLEGKRERVRIAESTARSVGMAASVAESKAESVAVRFEPLERQREQLDQGERVKPQPNIVMLGEPRLTFVTCDEKFVFRESLNATNLKGAIVVDFRNQLEVGQEIKGLDGVLSQLTFSNATKELSHPLNRGFWLGQESPEATFERGDTRSLFIGYRNDLFDLDKQSITTFDGRYETPVPVTFSPYDSINVRIALFTQTRHRFHKECELELTPNLQVTKPFA